MLLSIAIPTELVAVALVCSYWEKSISQAAFITPFFVAILVINFLGARWFAESEYVFSIIKCLAIVILM